MSLEGWAVPEFINVASNLLLVFCVTYRTVMQIVLALYLSKQAQIYNDFFSFHWEENSKKCLVLLISK